MDWVAVRLELAADSAEAVTNFLFEAGAAGVITEVRDVATPALPPGRARLEAHLPAVDADRVRDDLARYLASLHALGQATSAGRLEITPLAPTDWLSSFRGHHRPVAIGRRLLIAPPWDVPDGPRRGDRLVIVVEPGMAFGTGQHATTRTCLEEIEALVTETRIASALDVGTGSGVLAAALARLGVGRVVALDVDPAVIPAARATLRRNGAAGVTVLAGTAAAVRAPFDLVVANLLLDAIVADGEPLARAVAPGGHLVLSGLLDAQVDAARDAFPRWRLAGERSAEGWRTLRLVRE